MNKNLINKIFSFHNLETVQSIDKIEIGFSNEVFSINDKFILKICKDIENESRFEKESFFYNFYQNKIPLPEIIIYDNSKNVCDYFFLIYFKIQGVNLYSKWHILKEEERRNIIKEICNILKRINNEPIQKFVTKFKLDANFNWQEKIVSKINESLAKIARKNILNEEEVDAICNFVLENKHVLLEQHIKIVYWDIHFDNVIVQQNKVVGIIDFERTELCSIDFVLDIVRRMVNYPKKYVSAQDEKYIRGKDYAKLLDWYEEFYPELFNFKNLEIRLDLYSIKHDLETLIHWPNYLELKEIILKTVNFK